MAQPKKRVGEELSEMVFVLDDLWQEFSFVYFPERLDRVQRRRIRQDETELDAEFNT